MSIKVDGLQKQIAALRQDYERVVEQSKRQSEYFEEQYAKHAAAIHKFRKLFWRFYVRTGR